MEKKVHKKNTPAATGQFDRLAARAEQERKEKKPGSQSHHSKQHNNGRGGGK